MNAFWRTIIILTISATTLLQAGTSCTKPLPEQLANEITTLLGFEQAMKLPDSQVDSEMPYPHQHLKCSPKPSKKFLITEDAYAELGLQVYELWKQGYQIDCYSELLLIRHSLKLRNTITNALIRDFSSCERPSLPLREFLRHTAGSEHFSDDTRVSLNRIFVDILARLDTSNQRQHLLYLAQEFFAVCIYKISREAFRDRILAHANTSYPANIGINRCLELYQAQQGITDTDEASVFNAWKNGFEQLNHKQRASLNYFFVAIVAQATQHALANRTNTLAERKLAATLWFIASCYSGQHGMPATSAQYLRAMRYLVKPSEIAFPFQLMHNEPANSAIVFPSYPRKRNISANDADWFHDVLKQIERFPQYFTQDATADIFARYWWRSGLNHATFCDQHLSSGKPLADQADLYIMKIFGDEQTDELMASSSQVTLMLEDKSSDQTISMLIQPQETPPQQDFSSIVAQKLACILAVYASPNFNRVMQHGQSFNPVKYMIPSIDDKRAKFIHELSEQVLEIVGTMPPHIPDIAVMRLIPALTPLCIEAQIDDFAERAYQAHQEATRKGIIPLPE